MNNIAVIAGIVVFLGFLVYIIRAAAKGEIENAALEKSKTALETQLETMNREYLRTEAERRAKEKKDAEAFDDDMERTTTPYYPGVSNPDRDPDGYN